MLIMNLTLCRVKPETFGGKSGCRVAVHGTRHPGTLIAPFNAPQFEVESEFYYLVRSAEANWTMTPAS
jgi:hypothetical protein